MILKKEFNILKKPYLTPRIEFEEIESDEREMLMASNNQGSGPSNPGEGGLFSTSLDANFESESLFKENNSTNNASDFVINDY